jgi:hypothetical protein
MHPAATRSGERFRNELEQGGTFEQVRIGRQRVLDRLNRT